MFGCGKACLLLFNAQWSLSITWTLSGGHTAELMSYLRLLPPNYSPRIYVVASNDNLSGEKALEFENTRLNNDLPRARGVGQSYITSIFTTCYAIVVAALLVLKHCPRLVLCNGPGTCVPVCLAAWRASAAPAVFLSPVACFTTFAWSMLWSSGLTWLRNILELRILVFSPDDIMFSIFSLLFL
ncbi:hypothetical protein TcWFU_010366 [Taenia crassiceps]|uniref:UDP-N-acetylglucosamine transferase subunit ALG14 n=1 Tax=Taenia crassiceps TaxID=6207 RepID=A0ABR4QU69_9CEST